MPPPIQKPGDCCTPCPDVQIQQIPGPKGDPGTNGTNGNNGINAFTITSAQFVQPASSATVVVSVVVSDWATVGQEVFVATGGDYQVTNKAAGQLTLKNLGYPNNAAPATNVPASSQVSPSGVRGPQGANGTGTFNSPTTTKGDLIVDNGATSPIASDVRFGVGTDGKELTADSSQPTGLSWKQNQPNTVIAANSVARYNGITGTPVPLQDSKMLITDDGALQSTPTGGSARGAQAVDLQVLRSSAGNVASGAQAVVGGGINNKASGAQSTVPGGDTNTASNTDATSGGGKGNVASGVTATVSGGLNNTASGQASIVGGGSGNTAGGQNGTVSGGNGNSASQTESTVSGGVNNTSSGAQSTTCGGSGNVSSGNGSVIVGGVGNISSQQSSGVLCGEQNVASEQYSSVTGGVGTVADKYGQVAHGIQNASAAPAPVLQMSEVMACIATSDATPTELFCDGVAATKRLKVPTDTSWGFSGQVVGRTSAGVTAMYGFRGAIKNNSGTTSLVSSPVIDSSIGDGAWPGGAAVAITADNANSSLKFTVTGAVGTNISWLAGVRLVEVNVVSAVGP